MRRDHRPAEACADDREGPQEVRRARGGGARRRRPPRGRRAAEVRRLHIGQRVHGGLGGLPLFPPPRPWRSIRAIERSMPPGWRSPCPAIWGAEPCTGSKSPGPPSPSEAEAASPSPPVTAAATSERMSPNVFSVSTTSIVSGAFTITIANESTSAWSSRTSGYSAAPSPVTTSRQSREVCRTLTLSTDVSRPARGRASSKARRATRSTSGREYSHVSNQVPSSRVPFAPK